jgi:hypothetical protein
MPNTLTATPNLQAIYNVTLEIDTTPTATTPTWAAVCAGIDNLEESLNEESDTYFFLCGKGFGDSEVTGMAPEIKLTGKRVTGDAAQEYIFGFAQKYGLYAARHSHMRVTITPMTTPATSTIISANITIKDVSEIKGDANKPSDIGFTLAMDGTPQSGDAWAA